MTFVQICKQVTHQDRGLNLKLIQGPHFDKKAQVNFSGPKTSPHPNFGTFKIKNLATSNCVKDWGKVAPRQG